MAINYYNIDHDQNSKALVDINIYRIASDYGWSYINAWSRLVAGV